MNQKSLATVLASMVAMVALGACATTPSANEQLAQRAEKETADSLKDPTSAKFKDVIASAKINCIYGKLLAKNSLGAYTGYHDFVWINGQSFINAGPDEILNKTDYLEQMNAYMENIGKCQFAMPHGSGPDRESNIPDT